MNKTVFAATLAIAAVSLGLVTTDAHADVVFTADGVPGTSVLARPPAPNAIDATSFMFTATTKAGAPELVIVRRADRATGPLLAAASSVQRFKSVSVFLVGPSTTRPGGPVYRATLMDATITSLKFGGQDGDGAATETLTFDFAKAEVEVFAQDPKTGALTSVGKTVISGRR